MVAYLLIVILGVKILVSRWVGKFNMQHAEEERDLAFDCSLRLSPNRREREKKN